jgi:cystathionine beta-synthase
MDNYRTLHKDILSTIGNTPLVKLNRVTNDITASIYAKLEFMNPGSSIKDRIAAHIIQKAECEGKIKPGWTIVEATSGNTGMGLALYAAVKGYHAIFVMPDKQSQEKIMALRAFGAKVIITPTAVPPDDPRSYYSVAKRIVKEKSNTFYANQYFNPANPEMHYLSTGPEIWEQTEGKVDAVVGGLGTGGTITGIAKFLKEKNEKIEIIGVDPIGSIFYEYFKTGHVGEAHPYKIEGIGEDILPSTIDFKLIDDVIQVTDKESFLMARNMSRLEGIFAGGSSGGAVVGAIKYAKKSKNKKLIVVIIPDSGSRYLNKVYNDDWMREHSFLEPEDVMGYVQDVMHLKPQDVIVVKNTDRVTTVISKMRQYNISQMPVIDEKNKLIGIIAEKDILEFLLTDKPDMNNPIVDLVDTNIAIVNSSTQARDISNIFQEGKVAIVINNDKISGVLTKIDLIEYLSRKIK